MPRKFTGFLQRWLINTVAVMVAANLIPGIRYESFTALLVAALLLGILNAYLRWLLVLLALPLVILTLGLFLLVINALMLWLVGSLVRGFHVDGFWPAFWGALIITVTTMVLNALTGSGNSRLEFRGHRSPPPPRKDDDQDGPVIDV